MKINLQVTRGGHYLRKSHCVLEVTRGGHYLRKSHCVLEVVCEKEMASCVRGYHIYKDIWAAAIAKYWCVYCKIIFA